MKKTWLSGLLITLSALASAPAQADVSGYYIGEVLRVSTNFCPQGSLEADGRLLPISSYSALFSLLGTQYGGDGRSTFALPDLRTAELSQNADGGRSAIKHCVVVDGLFPSRS